ncbi:Auxin-induced protein 5NG4 [Hordeum vulgare]|nr:Auxin-induced protein 5NG4 [Hordeum vulgare]
MPYPGEVVMEDTLRVWAISRWRGSRELSNFFLTIGYRHETHGSPVMFHVEVVHANVGLVTGVTARFTNRFDAHFLHGKVVWCGCEFIAFTTHNIFTNLDNIFPTAKDIHTLPYNTEDEH